MKGRIKKIFRSYGFIEREGAKDLFFHFSKLVGDYTPQAGDEVEFLVGHGKKGPEARDVRTIAPEEEGSEAEIFVEEPTSEGVVISSFTQQGAGIKIEKGPGEGKEVCMPYLQGDDYIPQRGDIVECKIEFLRRGLRAREVRKIGKVAPPPVKASSEAEKTRYMLKIQPHRSFGGVGVVEISVAQKGHGKVERMETHASGHALTSLVDKGVLSARFCLRKTGEVWILEENFKSVMSAFEEAGLPLPFSANFTEKSAVEVSREMRAFQNPQSKAPPQFYQGIFYQKALRRLREGKTSLLDPKDLEKIQVYANWARERLEAALKTTEEGGDWGRLLEVRKEEASVPGGVSPDGLRRDPGYTRRYEVVCLALIPVGERLLELAGISQADKISFYEEAEKIDRIEDKWAAVDETTNALFVKIATALIKGFEEVKKWTS